MVGMLLDAWAEVGGVKPEGLAGFLKYNMSNRKVQEQVIQLKIDEETISLNEVRT